MRLAIIDLGTNSVRFDVYQINPGSQKSRGKTKKLHSEKLMVRLGQGVFVDGRLAPEAIVRTVQAFSSFKKTAELLGVQNVAAFATSALRDASDSKKLIQRVLKTSGIEIKIISGAEEARLIATGILKNEKKVRGFSKFALVDIGGGSVEVSVCQKKSILRSESFDLGAARLQQVFLKTNPPRSLEQVDQLRQYIQTTLQSVMRSQKWPKAARIVGSSGTIRALVRMGRHFNHKTTGPLTRETLKKIIVQIQSMTPTQLLSFPGMEARRVDMILAGALLFDEVMRELGAKKATSTEYSLRDGILTEELKRFRSSRMNDAAFDISTLIKIKGAENDSHVKQVLGLCTQLFDKLKLVHRLPDQWRLYLQAAAVLHDWGKLINTVDHPHHSEYMVLHADFPLMSEWEREFIALLCRYHRTDKVTEKLLPFGKNSTKKKIFLKVLAIFQVADALDRNHRSLVSLKNLKVRAREVELLLKSRTSVHLELLRVEQKKVLFERIFKKKLSVRLE